MYSLAKSVLQGESCGALHVAPHPVRNDFSQRNFRLSDPDDAAIVLPHELTWQNLVDEPVFGLHQTEAAALTLERSNHGQGIQGILLKEFAVAFRIRAHAAGGDRRCA